MLRARKYQGNPEFCSFCLLLLACLDAGPFGFVDMCGFFLMYRRLVLAVCNNWMFWHLFLPQEDDISSRFVISGRGIQLVSKKKDAGYFVCDKNFCVY